MNTVAFVLVSSVEFLKFKMGLSFDHADKLALTPTIPLRWVNRPNTTNTLPVSCRFVLGNGVWLQRPPVCSVTTTNDNDADVEEVGSFWSFVIQLCKSPIDILTFQNSTIDLLKKCNYLWHPPRALPQRQRENICFLSLTLFNVESVIWESKQIMYIIRVPSVLQNVLFFQVCAHVKMHHLHQD